MTDNDMTNLTKEEYDAFLLDLAESLDTTVEQVILYAHESAGIKVEEDE